MSSANAHGPGDGSGDGVGPAPLRARARLGDALVGWAFAPRVGLGALAALAAFGAALVAAEYARPRAGLRLPFEDQPGFYAAVAAGAVAAALLIAAALNWLLVRERPYPDDLFDPEPRDDDHA
jgi:hypothetical protein